MIWNKYLLTNIFTIFQQQNACCKEGDKEEECDQWSGYQRVHHQHSQKDPRTVRYFVEIDHSSKNLKTFITNPGVSRRELLELWKKSRNLLTSQWALQMFVLTLVSTSTCGLKESGIHKDKLLKTSDQINFTHLNYSLPP